MTEANQPDLKTGRWSDVLVQPILNANHPLEHGVAGFNVWADEGLGAVLSKVPGIWSIATDNNGLYIALLDYRYDPEIVKDQIETVVLLAMAQRQVASEPKAGSHE